MVEQQAKQTRVRRSVEQREADLKARLAGLQARKLQADHSSSKVFKFLNGKHEGINDILTTARRGFTNVAIFNFDSRLRGANLKISLIEAERAMSQAQIAYNEPLREEVNRLQTLAGERLSNGAKLGEISTEIEAAYDKFISSPAMSKLRKAVETTEAEYNRIRTEYKAYTVEKKKPTGNKRGRPSKKDQEAKEAAA